MVNAASECTVVVSSFDGFQDCWEAFAHGLTHYWPDCPCRVILLTGKLKPELPGIEILALEKDYGWAGNLQRALERIETSYVLYLQDDYWLERSVDTAAFLHWLSEMSNHNWGYLRLLPVPPPDEPGDSGQPWGICSHRNRYRTCLQAAIWEKNFLQKLLFDGESGWDFERESQMRSVRAGLPCLCLTAPLLDYCEGTAVRKGRWTRGAIRYARRERLNLTLRKRENRLDEFCNRLGGWPGGKLLGYPILRLMQVLRGDRKWEKFFK